MYWLKESIISMISEAMHTIHNFIIATDIHYTNFQFKQFAFVFPCVRTLCAANNERAVITLFTGKSSIYKSSIYF